MKITYHLSIISIIIITTSCGSSNQENTETSQEETHDLKYYEGLGTQITAASFLTLSGKVKAAMQEGGVPNAVDFCKEAAHPLIDSLSKIHNATIRRKSLKPRNANNTPTPEESSVLKQFEVDWQLNQDVMPFAEDLGAAGVNFYAPIWTQKACLQCHGVIGETLTEENNAFIKDLYPTDKATGYNENDLRGMWVVNFRKN